ncbi:MAG: hypothetical protein ACTHKU_02515, partial [Verrucomicrobiota bacterium]
GALAAALSSTFLSATCWGVGTQIVGVGYQFLALAAIVSSESRHRWIKLALAGMAVGMGVTEGIDNGALFSLFIAAFVVYRALILSEGSLLKRFAQGISRVALVALCAGLIATQTLTALIGTQVKGIAGLDQNDQSKQQNWDWATQWSFPKRETLGFVIPGLFGFRMDTPDGGNYWGIMGRDPAWDRYFAGDKQGPPPQGTMRFSGGGNYLGVPVALLALWAALQSLRRKGSVFSMPERKVLWFWVVVAVVSLLLAFGRFAPFYQFIYRLPYFSTIRNPAKFVAIFNWAVLILFAYGVQSLMRYLKSSGSRGANWWNQASRFDRRWTLASIAAVILSGVGWMIYSSSRPALERYLQTVQIDGSLAPSVASFSVGQVASFLVVLSLTVAVITLILSGKFSGPRAKWGVVLLGLVLVTDLARANMPWIKYWDYKQKYASNPVIDTLRQQPYEHRVAILPFRSPAELALFDQLYRIEWAQHQFQYYNVQSLDVVQMPRVAQDLQNYESALQFRGTADSTYLLTRRWALTNTRYLLGPAGFLDVLNQQIDPEQRRFRIVESFNVVPKAGVLRPTRLEELTAEPATNGAYALFEFTGALPRAKLYSSWQVPAKNPDAVAKLKSGSWNTNDLSFLKNIGTNDFLTLETLAARDFDPHQTVLLADTASVPATTNATNQNSGTVEYTSYAPKDIRLKTKSKTDSVLLLNDKYDPVWQVSVDGKRADLLRANYIMRGVFVPAGEHTVEFQFKMDSRPLYISLAAEALAVGLLGFVAISRRKPSTTEETPAAAA